jgi:hypothetical protein
MLVYIAGYGRSGSTLLDVILHNHPNIFGAGELTWLFQRAVEGKPCACGLPIPECSLWREVLRSIRGRLPNTSLDQIARATFECEHILPQRRMMGVYSRAWITTFEVLRTLTGCQYIVDSSKSNRVGFHRYRLLSKLFPGSTRMIHLIRSPRAVLGSLKHGTNKSIAVGHGQSPFGGALRVLASWTLSNVAAEMQTKRSPQERILLTFDEFIGQPQQSLARLGGFLCLDMRLLQDHVATNDAFDGGHGVDGNRMRLQKPIRMLPKVSNCLEMPVSFWEKTLLTVLDPLWQRYYTSSTALVLLAGLDFLYQGI